MKSGDILLFRGEKGISKIIAWGTGSLYSHSAICVNSEMNLAIESIAGWGVRARDIRQIKAKYDVFRVKGEYGFDLNKVISFLISNLNRKYDWAGVFYLGLLKLFRLKKLANKWQKNRDYFCFELTYLAFKAGGLKLVPKKAGIVSGKDLSESEIVEKV